MNETSSQRPPQEEGRQEGEGSHTDATHAGNHPDHGHAAARDGLVAGAGAWKDPVCGMAVAADSAFQTEHARTPYYFCSASCQRKFEADPTRYTTPAEAPAAESVPSGTICTCPMHPEIRQDHPGNRVAHIGDRSWKHWWDAHGSQLPAGLAAEIEREVSRLALVVTQIKTIETQQHKAVKDCAPHL